MSRVSQFPFIVLYRSPTTKRRRATGCRSFASARAEFEILRANGAPSVDIFANCDGTNGCTTRRVLIYSMNGWAPGGRAMAGVPESEPKKVTR